MDLITSLTSTVVNKALDGLSKRQVAISSNLANADTPHYRRKDVRFEDALSHAIENTHKKPADQQRHLPASNNRSLSLQTTRPEHIAIGNDNASMDSVAPVVEESEDLQFRNDGNAVDLETEMAQLAKNTQRYNALANIESRRGKALKGILNS